MRTEPRKTWTVAEAGARLSEAIPLPPCVSRHGASASATAFGLRAMTVRFPDSGRPVHAIISRPFALTSASSLSAIWLGCLPPHSHFEMSPAVTPICAANTA